MPKNQPDLTKPNPFLAEGGLSLDNNGFGKNNWYDWSIKNWGTKWEIQGGGYLLLSNSVIFNFESAWSPPVLAFDNFKLHFKLEYFESGACYYGIASNKSGELEDTSASIRFKAERYDDLDMIREAMLEMALEDGIEENIIDNLNMPDAYYNEDYEDENESEAVAEATN
jgi:hypothetical protein